jgi:hypothetical protein
MRCTHLLRYNAVEPEPPALDLDPHRLRFSSTSSLLREPSIPPGFASRLSIAEQFQALAEGIHVGSNRFAHAPARESEGAEPLRRTLETRLAHTW